MIRAAILDFDDVIMATGRASAENARIALGRYKEERGLDFKVPTVEEILDGYAPTWGAGIQQVVPSIDMNDFKPYYDILKEELPSYPLFDGALEALESIAQQVAIMGMITSRSRSSLERRAPEAGLDLRILDFYFGKEDLEYHKPDPRAFEPALLKLQDTGISKDEAVYFGDMPTDAQAAEGAGIPFVGILTGPRSHELQGNGYVLLPSVTDIPDYIETTNSND